MTILDIHRPHAIRLGMWVVVSLWLGFSGCTSPIASKSCDDVSDCPAGQLCSASLCVNPMPDASPPDVECYLNEDCGDAARCVEGQCFQNECQEGATQPCNTSCGSGEQLCSGGVWRACNNQPTTEVCGTGEDEDCDGEVDEGCGGCVEGEERVCRTDCGEGRERCFGGQFRGCTASRPRQSEFCGDPTEPVDDDCDGEIDEGCDNCDEGDRRACETDCGVGEEVCIERTWRNCTARLPSDELCDGIDNDCDQSTDEDIIRSCDNACGPGFEQCNTGTWVGCDAPENCNCSTEQGVDSQLCGSCGQRTRMCATPEWGPWSECQMVGQCNPGASEEGPCGLCGIKRRYCVADCQWGEWQACLGEGICNAGETETEACPSGCGERTRTCDGQCQWGEWSSCGGAGVECSIGETDSEVCDACGGTRQRSCTSTCQWGAWGMCESTGCTPGDTEDRSCGTCQTQTRVCSEQCTWGDWGECSSGSCTPSEVETRDCGLCGQQTRTCTTACGWSEWSACLGEGVCTPGDELSEQCGVSDVGACSFGTQISSCNEQCDWEVGACRNAVNPTAEICGSLIDSDCNGELLTNPDQYEFNDTCDSCTSLAGNPNRLVITALMDNVDDTWDYFCFQTEDSITPFQSIDVNLDNIPNGQDYDLYLYRSREACNSNNYLAVSNQSAGESESISWGEGFGDDGGVYVIGVRAFAGSYSCSQSYSLTISGF